MKHFFTLIFTLMGLPLGIMAQGWPANYGGVMLQGFYWDSYSDTQWTNLTSQADELSKYFNLIWVPQSGWCNSTTDNMGYYPIYWFDQNSAFGTEKELRTMISTFKAKGTDIIADVVVNHKNGVSNWCDFANETVKGTGKNTGKTYSVTWDNKDYTQICNNDEANTDSRSEAKGLIKGAADTGLGDTGCRDLDHTNATTQQNIKTYEDFLLNEMGYTGFRYDFVKGYDPKYIKIYNEASKPKFSVGEYWQGTVTDTWYGDHPFGGVKDWVEATGKTSAAFDFPM
ncbi:MAG: alpha-amylase family glycosyl hydrolase, partial [Prevotella sp.]|nr:alpha-amylase family glycosyl hydrolase [Prevotella sp.]